MKNTGTVCSAAGDLSKDVEEEEGKKMKSVFAAHGKRRGVRWGGGIEQAVGEEKKSVLDEGQGRRVYVLHQGGGGGGGGSAEGNVFTSLRPSPPLLRVGICCKQCFQPKNIRIRKTEYSAQKTRF